LARALAAPMIVGSGDDAGFKLKDSAVSHHHLELHPRADGVFVRDLGSTNGTLLAGARIDTAFVEAQAVISLGRTLLAVSVVAEEQELDGPEELEGMVATGASMRRVFGLVEKLARANTPVLFLGEQGTGKARLASALHVRSRRKGAFVTVDCTSSQVESALFERGFKEAEGGTLLLDEVSALPLELQPRLLRALEGHAGGDVRMVAASTRALDAEAKAGRFRDDLYLRVAVAAVRVPPLRERKEDLPALVRSMLVELGRGSFELSAGLTSTLSGYSWPGNVRELRTVVARAVVSDEVSVESVLNPGPQAKTHEAPSLDVPFKEAKEKLVESFTREYLVALSAKHEGNVTQMAKASGLARTYLHDLLSRYSLSRSTQRDQSLPLPPGEGRGEG
jgi:DNA-binding NtrC family response regulator